MKIGVKTYDDYSFLKHFENKVDFFEVQAIQKNDYSFLKKLSHKIVIHAEHQGFGVNLADKSREKFNLKAINFAKKIADSINAKKMIFHPGHYHGENISIKNTINFLKKHNDKRLLAENLPYSWTFSSPKEIKMLLKETKVGFCFDLNHALSHAWKNKKNFERIVKEFLKLNPSHFHIGGQVFLENNDISHLPLKKSNYEFLEFLEFYPKNAEITLETTTNIKEVEQDVKLLKKIIKK